MTEPPTFGPIPEKYVPDFALLLEDPRFLAETDPARQVYIAIEILRAKGERIPFDVIGSFFRASKGAVYTHWKRCRRGPIRLPGRTPKIPPPIKAQMFAYIADQFAQGRPVSYEGILDWLYTEHHLLILSDTLRHTIRKTPAFKTIKGIPTEEPRCFVTSADITEHFRQLAIKLEGVPAHFIFNVDESSVPRFCRCAGDFDCRPGWIHK
jgi:hypothetical protein